MLIVDPRAETAGSLGEFVFRQSGVRPVILHEASSCAGLSGIDAAFVSVEASGAPLDWVIKTLSGKGALVYVLVETPDPDLVNMVLEAGGRGVISRSGEGSERQVRAVIRKFGGRLAGEPGPPAGHRFIPGTQGESIYHEKPEVSNVFPGTWEGAPRFHGRSSTPVIGAVPGPDGGPVPSPRASACIVVFFSNKGGVGKTTISVSTAVALSGLKKSVCLIDLDVYKGNVCSMLGIVPKATILDWAGQGSDPASCLTPHESGVKVLAAPPQPLDGCYVTAETVAGALDVLSRRFDYIIVDTCPVPEDIVLLPIERADYNFLVGEPGRITLGSINTVMTSFVKNNISIANFSLVINRMPRSQPLKLADYLDHLPPPLSGKDRCIVVDEDRGVSREVNNFRLPVGSRSCRHFNSGLGKILCRIDRSPRGTGNSGLPGLFKRGRGNWGGLKTIK
ncbi:MAG: AAA family ATPase [Bacillota bacterium]